MQRGYCYANIDQFKIYGAYVYTTTCLVKDEVQGRMQMCIQARPPDPDIWNSLEGYGIRDQPYIYTLLKGYKEELQR